MSKYKRKMPLKDAIEIMDSMLKVRRNDTRVKSADAIETVLYALENPPIQHILLNYPDGTYMAKYNPVDAYIDNSRMIVFGGGMTAEYAKHKGFTWEKG